MKYVSLLLENKNIYLICSLEEEMGIYLEEK